MYSGFSISWMADPRPAARPPNQGPSRMPESAHMILPRWKAEVPTISAGTVIRRADPAAVSAASKAAVTIHLVVSFRW